MQVINLEATISTPTLQAEINTPSLQVEMRTLRLGGGGGGTTDYNDLTNKPKIEGVTLQGNVPISDLGLRTSDLINDSGFITTGDIPTKTSDLTNDSDYQTGAEVAASITAAIPTNVSYFTNDIGYITSAAVPTNVSAFTNDVGYLTINDLPSFAVNSVNGQTGDVTLDGSNLDYDANTSINDKIDSVEASVPTKTSDITNDSGFITAADIPVQSVNGQTGVIDLLEMGTYENISSTLTVTDAGASGIPYLTLDITPRQNLNGYDKPWAGGTGKNKMPIQISTQTINDVTFTVNSDGSFIIDGTASGDIALSISGTDINRIPLISDGETLTLSGCPAGGGSSTFRAVIYPYYNGSYVSPAVSDTGSGATVTRTFDSFYAVFRIAAGVSFTNETVKMQFEFSSTATTWEPYENNCPIYDWAEPSISINGEFPFSSTIYNFYGGTYDCIAGHGMNTYSHIASYAGESINEPWMSSLDEYIPGTTPTTGAEVVYLDEDNAVARSGNSLFKKSFVDGTNTVALVTTRANFTIKMLKYFKNTTNEFLQKLIMLIKAN